MVELLKEAVNLNHMVTSTPLGHYCKLICNSCCTVFHINGEL